MICFDTGPLIWGVQGVASSGQGEMIERTSRYIRHLTEARTPIVVPAPVLGEYLMGFDDEEVRGEQARLVERHFRVPSLDGRAAVLAASLEKAAWPNNLGVDRQRFRIDAQIVAIGIVIGAEKLVTHDPHMRDLAGGRLGVIEVPSIAEQLKLRNSEGQ